MATAVYTFINEYSNTDMIYVSMRTHDRKSIQRRKIIPWMALSLQTDNDLLQDILDS